MQDFYLFLFGGITTSSKWKKSEYFYHTHSSLYTRMTNRGAPCHGDLGLEYHSLISQASPFGTITLYLINVMCGTLEEVVYVLHEVLAVF